MDSGNYSGAALPTGSYRARIQAYTAANEDGSTRQADETGRQSPRGLPGSDLLALLDTIDEGVYSIDRAGCCTFINRAGAELLGYAPDELLGRDIHSLVHDRYPSGAPYPRADCSAFRALHEGQPQPRTHETLWRRDGTALSVELSSLPVVEDRRITGAAVTFRPAIAPNLVPARLDSDQQNHRRYYESLVQGVDDGILIADREGNYLDANAAALDLLGYSRAELLRMRVSDVVMAGSGWTSSEYARFVRDGHWRGELELRRKDGSRVPVEARATVIDAPFGKIYASVLGDITERRKAEERLRDEAQIIETLHRIGTTLAAELDLQHVVQVVTDAATELSGAEFGSFFYNLIDEQGESLTLYTLSGVPHEAFAQFPMPRNTHVFGPTFRGEGIIRLADVTQDQRYGRNPPYHGIPEGHLLVRSYLAVPVISRSGEVLGGLLFGHSATGMFTERHERLVAGIAAQAAVAIDNARLFARAQEAARQREEFLSIASHELKTPLTTVKGYSQMLQRLLLQPELNRPRLEAVARRLIDQSDRLEMLVADLLDMSRIQSGRLELRPQATDLVDLSRRAVEHFRETVEYKSNHRLILDAEGPVIGDWDPERLDQILANLISNALKYSPNGGDILVRVRQDIEQAEAELIVRDQGVGIALDEQTSLFEPFVRGEAGRMQASGTGLGLYITRLIAEQHGGSIAVESRRGAGSTFTVRLPVVRPGAVKQEPVNA